MGHLIDKEGKYGKRYKVMTRSAVHGYCALVPWLLTVDQY